MRAACQKSQEWRDLRQLKVCIATFLWEQVMKRSFVALLASLVLGGGVFAENYTKGIDIQMLGISIAATTMENVGGGEFRIAEACRQFKIATYDCFMLKNTFGIYASVAANIGVILTSDDDWSWVNDFDGFFGISGEFMIGPAIGVNLGKTRFQTGIAFHALTALGIGSDDNIHFSSLGFALTPQFRFTADRRCSFILGCDFTFDFPKNYVSFGTRYDNDEDGHVDYDSAERYEEKFEFDDGFRFGVTPYIGLGINF